MSSVFYTRQMKRCVCGGIGFLCYDYVDDPSCDGGELEHYLCECSKCGAATNSFIDAWGALEAWNAGEVRDGL